LESERSGEKRNEHRKENMTAIGMQKRKYDYYWEEIGQPPHDEEAPLVYIEHAYDCAMNNFILEGSPVPQKLSIKAVRSINWLLSPVHIKTYNNL
jgi:hypothetical protein